MTEPRVREARLPASHAPSAGEIRMVWVGEHRVGLFCIAGRLHALADRCPHRGAPLCSRGEVVSTIQSGDEADDLTDELALVRCPWHKWDFDVSSGRCMVDNRLRVRRYRVQLDGDEIVVSLDRPST